MKRIFILCLVSLAAAANGLAKIDADSLLQRKVDSLVLKEAKELRWGS